MSHSQRIRSGMQKYMRGLFLASLFLLLFLLLSSIPYSTVAAATLTPGKQGDNQQHVTSAAPHRQGSTPAGKRQLAATVHVLASLPPTTIVQFPLVPSGIKQKFPTATALVTVVRGNRDNSTSDTVTLDVQNMPPNTIFTVFFIQFANKPFGNVEYVADLTTRGDGSGETVFNVISFVAFAMDARNPGSSTDGQEGITSGINLEHMGMWFSSLDDARKVLNDDTIQGTIFDGGNPPLHAGPQAMTDGQTAAVL